MRTSLHALTLATAAALLPALAHADLTFNAGAVTDYRYRGISQSRLRPALQAGVDYGAGGFYLGAWGSTIQWIQDAGGDGAVELDLYGGYKGELAAGLGYDIGLLRYQYPGNQLRPNANTTEIYGALSYGAFTAKYSHSTGNLFGFANSEGSGYLDLSAGIDLGSGMTLTPHVGHQRVRRNGQFSYTDYSLTLAKDFNGVVASAALVDTSTGAYTGPGGKDLGKAGLVLGVKFNF